MAADLQQDFVPHLHTVASRPFLKMCIALVAGQLAEVSPQNPSTFMFTMYANLANSDGSAPAGGRVSDTLIGRTEWRHILRRAASPALAAPPWGRGARAPWTSRTARGADYGSCAPATSGRASA
eukprot:6317312-Pyramimonas_sp.AAC.1